MKNISFLLLISALFLQSCFVTRTTIGDGPRGKKGDTMVYSKARTFYLFAGLIRLNIGQPATPSHGNYQIKSAFNFGDMLINFLTFGILQSRVSKAIVFDDHETRPAFNGQGGGGTPAAKPVFATGDKVLFKGAFGKMTEGNVVAVGDITAVVEFTNMFKKPTKKTMSIFDLNKM